MSERELKLVWVNESILADAPHRGGRKREPQTDSPGPPVATTPFNIWAWFRTNWPAMAAIAFCVGLVWQSSKLYSRFELVEESVNGREGLKEAINGKDGLKEQTLKLTSKLENLEKLLLEPFKVKAKKLLGSKDVQIFHSDFLPQSVVSTFQPAKQEGAKTRYSISYTIELKDSLLHITGRIIDGQTMKEVGTAGAAIKIPEEIEKPQTYYLVIVPPSNLPFPRIKLAIVVMERLSPTEFILAAGVTPEPNQISSTTNQDYAAKDHSSNHSPNPIQRRI